MNRLQLSPSLFLSARKSNPAVKAGANAAMFGNEPLQIDNRSDPILKPVICNVYNFSRRLFLATCGTCSHLWSWECTARKGGHELRDNHLVPCPCFRVVAHTKLVDTLCDMFAAAGLGHTGRRRRTTTSTPTSGLMAWLPTSWMVNSTGHRWL